MLLEVMIAMALLGIAGVTLLAQLNQIILTSDRARSAEGRLGEASAFLDAVSLWTRADLDRHLGNRPNGPWRLAVDRIESGLYEVSIRDSTNAAVVIETVLYRKNDASPR